MCAYIIGNMGFRYLDCGPHMWTPAIRHAPKLSVMWAQHVFNAGLDDVNVGPTCW